jgi:thymidine kinase
MFSGKTSKIIETYKKYKYIGKNAVVVNYAEDTRYHETMLSTHDKVMIPCIHALRLSNIRDDVLLKADIIFINEGQFFADVFEMVRELVDTHGKIVYISALDGDFLRNKFGQVLDLIPYCNAVTKLSALCAECKDGTPASFSHRISTELNQVVIGSDNYQPLCRKCYLAK